MFVRIKKIKNQEYAYLVKNEWTSKGARQRVKKYLGKTIRPQRIKTNSYLVDEKKKYSIIIKDLIKHELENHKATEKGKFVIAMNEGFLCKETIQQLLKLKAQKEGRPDKEGEKLATALLESGLSLKGEEFSKLFEIWRQASS